MRRRTLLGAFGAAALPSLAIPAIAQEAGFPSRPLTLVIPFPPGGIVDTVGRLTASLVAQQIGQPVVIENRAGAGSAVANAHVATARPDGYTILSGGITLAILPNLQPELQPANPLEAFAPVGLTTTTPYILHVNRDLPVRSVAEFVAWAKARGGHLNMATSGLGTGTHLTWELFRRQAGLGGELLPYRGGVPAILDIQAGRAHGMFSAALEAVQAMRAGQTRPLAVTSLERLATLPDLPTLAENGFPGFETTSWAGWYVPAGTPDTAVARLSGALATTLRDPGVLAKLRDLGVTGRYGPPDEARRVLATETGRWGRLIREAGITGGA
ncbi:tripartite tricarboxylate transporter substrate binding protein [Roseomonas sp. NAR14]|uniref:Tripartite tricarboxylate transporter substrate binding protein n=1 Tax=Roseomonas acroporae TaxID=2937791 RepID=A0A9X2BW40_9PROT|nr:tripartite tricarboxylate transporter substrate binding protein [Roseomonas acroporae]MCK8787348.1 tripartite tricarboxylate transporter substrate binding protein [Roseomonas acroporae]